MILQCTFPVALNSTWNYAKKIERLLPLPNYITKRSSHVNKQGAVYQMLILYEFNKSNFAEAMEYICKQLNSLHTDFSISIRSHGHDPWYLTLERGGEV